VGFRSVRTETHRVVGVARSEADADDALTANLSAIAYSSRHETLPMTVTVTVSASGVTPCGAG
jgi:hypothetical protein